MHVNDINHHLAESGVREQMNTLTAYVDASQVYGSDLERGFQLREFSNGKSHIILQLVPPC